MSGLTGGPSACRPKLQLPVVLEEHVVAASPVDWAIGIVHPIFRGEKVKLRAKRVRG